MSERVPNNTALQALSVKEDYTLAWSRAVNGPPAHSTASTTLGGSRLQEGTWTRTNWRGVVKKDLQRIGLTWEEAEVVDLVILEWRWRVASRSTSLDVG